MAYAAHFDFPAGDVQDHIWRTGARANLPTAWLPPRAAGGAFAILEPPSRPSAWVGELLQQARAFGQKLHAAERLEERDKVQVRDQALSLLSNICMMQQQAQRFGQGACCRAAGTAAHETHLKFSFRIPFSPHAQPAAGAVAVAASAAFSLCKALLLLRRCCSAE